jgi:GntR family transcriptional regulator
MKLKIDHSSSLPLHSQVEELLRKMIDLPDYKNGGLLPREIDLAKKLGISRNTLRQATNKLEYEGLIVRKKGVGAKVAQKQVTTHLNDWLSFTQEMNDKGVRLIDYEIKVEWVEAEKKIADFFEIEIGFPILRLSRLRGNNDAPFVFFESYFHPRIGLTGEEDFTHPLYEILETDYHVSPTFSNERIKARLASVITSKRLRIKQGEPILQRERFVLDPGSRPLEYNIGFYIADRFTYTINIKR